MATVSLRNIKKTYSNGFKAIHNLNLEIEDGEMIVLVGPSGCGKSTSLRMVAGLEATSEGDLYIGDKRVNDLEPSERDIAMVFQNYALYPHMSVARNMGYGLKNQGLPRDEIRRKVEKAARVLEIEHLLDNKPKQLSGGQRQRVAMGRAIVRNPKVFLFDEPLSNLDAKLRVQMRIEIKRLQQEFATTAIYVTHDQVEAMTLADRLVVMNGGKVEQVGPPLDLYEKPETQFVAGFLGSPGMNFMPARIQGQALLVQGDHRIDLPDMAELAQWDGRDITFGVRPEHLEACSEAEADFHLKVDIIEPLGADTLLYGHLPGSDSLMIAEQPGKRRYTRGDVVPLRVDRERLHLFDAETEQRLNE
ncbi:sn-glycerol-3-phosphate import ATP-binding protein UgpC [Natronospirillum operosum]|uniref:sn-glycerol-3-phosphate import ATP-binding protein UgpC n=1 Tax=Natronospirillum operosum TaxID=2759953 RepID=A0A4Z0W907_9GAMM|nr:sn-glycerol-3-phosphate import ATP-binding protein UgpC [Natronospirillum operosum]TGG90255.1 sn-glycerol-3-phosphate import ATP-binding protein UgpC [Natronospirillum operosum]